MPDKLFMPTYPTSPFSHAYTRTHNQPYSSPPGLAQWACYIKASAYGSTVGWSRWTSARTIHTYIYRECLRPVFLLYDYNNWSSVFNQVVRLQDSYIPEDFDFLRLYHWFSRMPNFLKMGIKYLNLSSFGQFRQ